MAYTEVKVRNKNKYYYRVLSVRKGEKITKKREYLGRDLSNEELSKKEKIADKNLGVKDKKDLSGLEKIKPKIIEILKKNNVKKAGIFGSYAEGKQRKNSDVDILVEPPKGIGLFGFTGLEMDLSENLNKKVDLVTYNGLSPFLKDRILKQEVRII
jgi:uncharacterized protein